MSSINQLICRKVSRYFLALKFAIKGAQAQWQAIVADEANEHSIDHDHDYHITIWHYAALTTAVLNLSQKIHKTASEFSLSTAQTASVSSRAEDLFGYVRIWQNTFKALLQPSHHLHDPCTICYLPPFQLHALIRKVADLWDPNYSRRTKINK
jgi:hypothetical protein